jgi:hypothetical protein
LWWEINLGRAIKVSTDSAKTLVERHMWTRNWEIGRWTVVRRVIAVTYEEIGTEVRIPQ